MLSKIVTVIQRGGGGGTLKKTHSGAILIEFSIAIPVLAAILYYFHDICRYKRIQSRLEFCIRCGVNLIQNISQERESKRITLQDLNGIFNGASLPFFGEGVRQYRNSSSNCPLGFYPFHMLFYVVGTGDNKAMIKWRAQRDSYGNGIVPGISDMRVQVEDSLYSVVKGRAGSEYNSWEIHPNLRIKLGEIKMIYEIGLWTDTDLKVNGKKIWTGAGISKSLFGFLVYTPKVIYSWTKYYCFFSAVVIFTPKEGLFSQVKPS